MILRRNFFALAALTGLMAIKPLRPGYAAASPPTLKPHRLSPGSAVGIISPAGATFRREELDIVVDAVRGLGLVPRLAPHVLDRYGYLAGQDRDRAADINQFFADPEIAALLPIRGDWGSSRVLPYLDYSQIRQNPKIIVGFSDITALLLGIYAKTGLITFHGPHGLTAWRPDQVEPFRQILFAGEALTFANSVVAEDRDRLMPVRNRIQTITPGQAQGRLIGGNLSVIAGVVGSPYLPDLDGAILFLEDVGESIYRIDRMLTQLKLAGVFDQLSGFIFGQCVSCGPDEDYGSLTLEEVLYDHIAPLGIPAWMGAAIGHVEPILTLPIGLSVAIDAAPGTIRMLEVAVI
ncbi:MAG: LD-carboxypeptidase [Leptolyngbyaceae cyanobacterium SM1_1_3]|nr:LD-carboxypeptidase [Leptolyngbyaceae cyanobacterium SM1_1_3]NJN01563.1 LD-carboxypeptidase [Leptolyngbyaceae cyanobacterium RM1_1_2]